VKAATTTLSLFLLGATIGGSGAYLMTRVATPTPPDGAVAIGPGVGAGAGAGAPELDEPPERARAQAAANDAASPAQRLDALTAFAQVSPEDAFAEALTLQPARLRQLGLDRVAREWASRKPEAAFEASQRLADRAARAALSNALLPVLARIDPAAVHQLVRDTVPEDLSLLHDGIVALAEDDPAAMIELIDAVGNSLKTDNLQRSLIVAIAANDPLAATALIKALPYPGRSQTYYRDIGRSYAESDPGAALAWATSLEAELSQPAVAGVLGEISQQDLARAVEIALTTPQVPLDSLSFGAASLSYNRDQLPQIADRLLASEDFQSEAVLGNLLRIWPTVDPDAALGWLLAQGSAIDADHVALLATADRTGYQESDDQPA
jgi:hypothetical protein